jgi:hypothetical protein
MGKFFSLTCGLVLVAAISLWGYGAIVVGGERAAARSTVDKQIKDLAKQAQNSETIKNEKFIEYADKLLAVTQAEEKDLLALMASRKIAISADLLDKEPAQFRQAVSAEYAKDDKLLADKGVRAPTEAAMRGRVFKWEDVKPSDKVRILRDVVVVGEITAALADAAAEVTYEVKGEAGVDRSAERRRVDVLKSLKFVEDASSAEAPKAAAPVQPYRETKIELVFHAHYNVVLDVLRRIELSKKCLFIVKTVRVKRLDVNPVEFAPDLQPLYTDVPTHELPVEAEVTIGLLEFAPKTEPAQQG